MFDSCTCRCKDHNHFTVLAAQTLVTIERQMHETRGRDEDKLFAERRGCHAPRQAAASGARTCTTFEYAISLQTSVLSSLSRGCDKTEENTETCTFRSSCSCFMGELGQDTLEYLH